MKKAIIPMIMIIILLLFCSTAIARESIAINFIQISFYNETMQKIDEAVFDDFSEGCIDYIYPITAKFMDITAQRQNGNDTLVLMIDEVLFSDEPYFSLEEDMQNIEITVYDSDESEQSFSIELMRNTLPRDNAIKQIGWTFIGPDDEAYYPELLEMDDGVTIAEVPNSVKTVVLDSFYTASTFTDIMVIDEHNDIYNGNSDVVTIDMMKETVPISIETYIDGTTYAYILSLKKVSELADSNELKYLSISFINGEESYPEYIIECKDGTYEYSAQMPGGVYGFELFTMPKHVMAKTDYYSSSLKYDEMGFPYFYLDQGITEVTIIVTAENGDKKTYTLNISKESETPAITTAEPSEVTSAMSEPNPGFPYWAWIAICGGALLFVAIIIIIIKMCGKRNQANN